MNQSSIFAAMFPNQGKAGRLNLLRIDPEARGDTLCKHGLSNAQGASK
jgi:hypothetical protein